MCFSGSWACCGYSLRPRRRRQERPSGVIVMLTTAVHYAMEDPGSLVESCQRALEWILRTHRGRPIRRTWIDATYTEEPISLQEME